MATNKTYNFDTPSNYSYDANKVIISGSKATLKLVDNAGQTFNQNFVDDTGLGCRCIYH